MSFNGVRLFRYAVLGEIALNLASIAPMLLLPETVLSYIVKGPNQITPATKSLTQWFGAVVIALTVPLALSYPNPRPSQGGEPHIPHWRRLTYMVLGAGEAALGTVMAAQYLSGDSGLTDAVLIGGTGTMGVLCAMRGFFLFVRPSWMDAQMNARKAL
ncbi:hypothetical protein LTR36_009151 [Oleoguttula mirabilis]|uniref:Uncharacterized protein n=1 Tax=Oleoguttula mirabilis TaxID=1507867 RepID=A0AAV9J6K6_9PEZI|nr:hypothetical protein LTR36_009151 [Oleoguttula mirabilis]